MISIHDKARNRWPAILPVLGVPAQFLRNQHGPCPICETPKKWFRFDNKAGSGSWICNGCGAGNGVDLVMKRNKLAFKEAVAVIERNIDGAPITTPPPQAEPRNFQAQMNRTWRESRPIAEGSAAAAYLHRRIGLTAFPSELRAHGRLWCKEEVAPATHRPAMLARVRDGAGKPVSIHRTYLTHEGKKADIDKPKRLMRSDPLPDVCNIALAKFTDTLGIAEGIETALSATALFGTPCWAVMNSALMEKWSPPARVRNVVIFADRDENYVGQQAAFELAHRLKAKGFGIDLRMPDAMGEDWNDVLMRSFG